MFVDAEITVRNYPSHVGASTSIFLRTFKPSTPGSDISMSTLVMEDVSGPSCVNNPR